MKYYIIAGEKSGDQHGAGLARQLLQIDGQTVIRGIGGDAMKLADVTLLFHSREMGVMGFTEVVSHLFRLNRLVRRCKKDLISFHPDAIILIDSAGFNLRIARFAKKRGFKVFYFIPPKVWAWGKWRLKSLRKNVNHIFVTLPFEQAFFAQQGFEVTYYGSPIGEQIDSDLQRPFKNKECDRKLVVLLPGSRYQEITKHLSLMLEVADLNRESDFVICGVDTVSNEVYNKYHLPPNTSISFDSTFSWLRNSHVAIVASGTATLEACLLRIPQLVIYKTGWFNYLIARLFIQVKFISLVNLIADKRIVQELLQSQCNKKSIDLELNRLMSDDAYRNNMLKSYEKIAKLLPKQNTYRKIALDIKESGSLKFAQV